MKDSKKGFLKCLEKISYSRRISEVFDDFIQISSCAFARGSMEDMYFSVIKKYSTEDLQLFCEALANMMNEYEVGSNDCGTWCDILGDVYEEIGHGNSSTGQFFTPIALCNLMAQMTVAENDNASCYDPACGSGRNLVAHSRLNTQNRLNVFYVASDIDIRCVNMTILNYIMYGMKGIVFHMNTITLEIFGGYRVYLAETALGIQPLSIDECKSYFFNKKNEPKIILNQPIKKEIIQLNLFDF